MFSKLLRVICAVILIIYRLVPSASADDKKPRIELFVADPESQTLKYFDGRNGKYLRDFSFGNGLGHPGGIVFGSDGNLYLSTDMPSVVQLFDGKTGQFLKTFASGHNLNNCTALAFGPDDKLYVASAWENQIKRFDGKTGTYLDEFLKGNTGGLDVIVDMKFGPDGHVYLISANHVRGKGPDMIKRYDGKTGTFLGDFAGGNGVDNPRRIVFGPDGNLYVLNEPLYSENVEVKRFNGKTGAFIDDFVPKGNGELKQHTTMAFGPDGDLYIAGGSPASVKHFSGKTGKYIGDLVTPGTGNMKYASAIVFRPSGEKRRDNRK